MTTDANQEPTQVLFDRGTLMDLFIGKPTFQRKLRQTDVLLEGIDEDLIYLGHKKLLPKKAMEQLVTIEGLSRRVLASKSLEFPLSGARFVLYHSLPDVLRELHALKERWDVAVRELIQQYPALKDQQLAELDAQCEKLAQQELSKVPGTDRAQREEQLKAWVDTQKAQNRQLYPTVDELPVMFRFQWRMFKISALSGLEQMSSLEQEDLIAAQQQIRQDLQRWVHSASVEMHKTLGEAAANALRILGRQGELHPRNLKPLFDAFETFKAIDFTGSSTFTQVIDQIRSQFGVQAPGGEVDYERTAERLNTIPNGISQFQELLDSVSKLAVEDVAKAAGVKAVSSVGEFGRLIEL
jgi:hypothetical protein